MQKQIKVTIDPVEVILSLVEEFDKDQRMALTTVILNLDSENVDIYLEDLREKLRPLNVRSRMVGGGFNRNSRTHARTEMSYGQVLGQGFVRTDQSSRYVRRGEGIEARIRRNFKHQPLQLELDGTANRAIEEGIARIYKELPHDDENILNNTCMQNNWRCVLTWNEWVKDAVLSRDASKLILELNQSIDRIHDGNVEASCIYLRCYIAYLQGIQCVLDDHIRFDESLEEMVKLLDRVRLKSITGMPANVDIGNSVLHWTITEYLYPEKTYVQRIVDFFNGNLSKNEPLVLVDQFNPVDEAGRPLSPKWKITQCNYFAVGVNPTMILDRLDAESANYKVVAIYGSKLETAPQLVGRTIIANKKHLLWGAETIEQVIDFVEKERSKIKA